MRGDISDTSYIFKSQHTEEHVLRLSETTIVSDSVAWISRLNLLFHYDTNSTF